MRDRATAVHLRAALILALDPDPGLARRARADVTRLARDTASPVRRHVAAPELRVTAAEHAQLAELADRAANALGHDTAALLNRWLANTDPTG